eukprot:gene7791-biopygen14352
MNPCHEEGVRDRNRFQLNSGREHPPRGMGSSETGHCYGGINVAISAISISSGFFADPSSKFDHFSRGSLCGTNVPQVAVPSYTGASS